MADLEIRLGCKLCRRGRSGFSLTDDGRAVYQAAKDLFRSCENFQSKVKQRNGSLSGELRIAVADSIAGNPDFRFESIIARIRDNMPNVSILMSEADPLAIEHQVLNDSIHMGIHTFPNHAPGLKYIELFSEQQTLYCGRSHPLFKGNSNLKISQVEQYDYAARTYYGSSLRAGKLRPKLSTAKCTSMEGIAMLILSGRFLGHLPWLTASRWLESGDMRPVLKKQLSYVSRFESVVSVGTQVSRSVEILGQYILDELSLRTDKE